ncbi:hypothetical protein E2C01_094772 [Portunus trituberculatus]|uniref:Uncharacterized protein n=1 Tax=Portunus trituberculatus TaxID=210409 RepID=A0A5B7JY39_PORTR|nr:hypothetical protein [Portunus trituberculatus]
MPGQRRQQTVYTGFDAIGRGSRGVMLVPTYMVSHANLAPMQISPDKLLIYEPASPTHSANQGTPFPVMGVLLGPLTDLHVAESRGIHQVTVCAGRKGGRRGEV